MLNADFNSLSRMEKLLYANQWPEYLFVNQYPVFGIFWNIFLLFIPFILYLFLFRFWQKNHFQKIGQKFIAFVAFCFWLLFIPNAAYIITDVRHISGYCDGISIYRVCPQNAWMIILFFIYGMIGWVAFVYLVRQMGGLIKIFKGNFWYYFFVILVIPLSSLGVLLGLINRWNSWELFMNPLGIFGSIALYFTDYIYFRNFLVFTLGLYLLYFLGEKIFRK